MYAFKESVEYLNQQPAAWQELLNIIRANWKRSKTVHRNMTFYCLKLKLNELAR